MTRQICRELLVDNIGLVSKKFITARTVPACFNFQFVVSLKIKFDIFDGLLVDYVQRGLWNWLQEIHTGGPQLRRRFAAEAKRIICTDFNYDDGEQ